jgi:hypothetical protein
VGHLLSKTYPSSCYDGNSSIQVKKTPNIHKALLE